MDLKKFDTRPAATNGAELRLADPVTGAPLTDEASKEYVTITLSGADSPEYVSAQHKLNTARLNKRGGRFGRPKLSAEEIDVDSLELQIRCTKGWKHIVVEGAELPFTEENVRKLYTRFPWIREQVDEFINDRGNFLGN